MYVRVLVYAGAKREFLKEVGENRFELAVKAPAERNLANERVRECIAEKLQVAVAQVRIISGHHSQRKILSITNDFK
jgi:uncharacterized protein YggU (UPF0235/DUF167 family)